MATKKSATAAKKPAKKAATKKPATRVTTVTSTETKSNKFALNRVRLSRPNLVQSRVLTSGVAEFIGTFLLAGIVLATVGSPIFVLFGVVAIALAIGAVSGAHLNPAITIGAWVTRRITAARAAVYVVSQVLGALLAFVVFNAFVSAQPEVAAQQQLMMQGVNQGGVQLFSLGALVEGKEWYILAAELLGTAIFAFGVASVRGAKNTMASAYTIGGALFVALVVTSYLTGALSGLSQGGQAVINPAIAAALQGFSWNWWPIAVYAVAPVAGGVLGFALRDLLNEEEA